MSMVFVYTGNGQSVPPDVVSVRFDPNVTEVEEEAFQDCKQLKSITIPSTVKKIGTTAFSCCSNLRKVVLNEGLQKIDTLAFCGCHALESIALPSTLAEIDGIAFYNCDSLVEVTMSGICEKIVGTAFLHCTSLERIDFPSISNRLNNIMQTKHYQIEVQIDEVRGVVERRGSELSIPASIIDRGRHWNTTKQHLEQIVSWIKYYEVKEATTLFELALWKAMDQVDNNNNPAFREARRIEVPGPVKDTILLYL